MKIIDKITTFITPLLLFTVLLFKDSIPKIFQTIIPILVIILGGLSVFFGIKEYKEIRKK